jgi:hypothetical protein
MVVSLGIMSVLMLSVGGVMLLAARAVPDAKSSTGAIVSASGVLEQLLAELQCAVTINSKSATMIEFTVADRDANSIDETIRYEWSGSAGAPLTRQYNGGPVVQVLADVRDFALSYDLKTVSIETPQGNESGEILLNSWSQTLYSTAFPITSTQRYGQYFFPTLPADAVSWRVTRVKVYGRTDGYWDGECRVQLQTPTAGKLPSGTVLEEKTLMETSLLAGSWEQEFYNAYGLSPTQGLCLVVKWIYGSIACQLYGYYAGASTADSFLLKTTDGSVTWSAPSGYGLKYRIYGTVTTSGTPDVQHTYYLHRVSVTLRSGTDMQATLQNAVRLLNKPEVSG